MEAPVTRWGCYAAKQHDRHMATAVLAICGRRETEPSTQRGIDEEAQGFLAIRNKTS